MKAALLLLCLVGLLAGADAALSYGIQCQTIIVRGSNGTQGEVGPQGPPGPSGPPGPQGSQGVFLPGTTIPSPVIVDGSATNLHLIDPVITTTGKTSSYVVFGEHQPRGMPGRYYGVLTAKVYRPINTILSRTTPTWFSLNNDRFALAGGGVYLVTVTAVQQSNAALGSLQVRLVIVDPATGLDLSEIATSWTTAGAASGVTMEVELETEVAPTTDTFYRIRNVASQATGYLGTAALASILTDKEVYLSVRIQDLETPSTRILTAIDTAIPTPFTAVGLATNTLTTTAASLLPLTTHSSTFHFRSQQVAGSLVIQSRLWATVTGLYLFSACRQLTTIATTIYVWYRINGVDVLDSTSQVFLRATTDSMQTCKTFQASLSAGDYLELVSSSVTAGATLVSNAAVGGTRPVSPSVSLVAYAPPSSYGFVSSTTNLNIQSATSVPVVFPTGTMTGLDVDRTTFTVTGPSLVIATVTITGGATGNTIEIWAGPSTTTSRWTSGGTTDVRQVSIAWILDSVSASVLVRSATAANTVHGVAVGGRPSSSGATLSVVALGAEYFHAQSSVLQTIAATATAQRVVFATAVANSGSVSVTNSATFTVAVSGAWYISVLLHVRGGGGGNPSNVFDMHLRKGLQGGTTGILENSGATVTVPTNTAYSILSRSWIVNLAAGDTVEAFVQCSTNGGTLATVAAAATAPLTPSSRILMTRISSDTPHSQVAASGPAF